MVIINQLLQKMLLNCIQFAVLISQQSHIHIGADIQASILEQNTGVVCGRQLEVSDSVQEETSQVQAPCWNLSSSRQTAAPSPVSPKFALFYPTFSFLLTPKLSF